jgi:hypothetical protein
VEPIHLVLHDFFAYDIGDVEQHEVVGVESLNATDLHVRLEPPERRNQVLTDDRVAHAERKDGGHGDLWEVAGKVHALDRVVELLAHDRPGTIDIGGAHHAGRNAVQSGSLGVHLVEEPGEIVGYRTHDLPGPFLQTLLDVVE